MTSIEQLEAWGLSAVLIGMAKGELPHPLFALRCEPLTGDYHTNWNLLDEHFVLDDPGSIASVALWERDYFIDHYVDVTHVGHVGDRLCFWIFAYGVDAPVPEPPIAHSEQGLLFWLFFDFIEASRWHDPSATEQRLREAAAAVGFGMLDGVLAFQEGYGTQPDARERLRQLTVTL